jgi:hypothetical protein
MPAHQVDRKSGSARFGPAVEDHVRVNRAMEHGVQID